jgi:hypothetical protein
MRHKGRMAAISRLEEILIGRQTPAGGWSFFESTQISVEATCFALLALSALKPDYVSGRINGLLRLQRHDGSWPAFSGDQDGSWTTALAMIVLNITSAAVPARERALHWLLEKHRREANWLWRWKFKTADRNVRFDPDKYGWPWFLDSASWVIPTAFSVIAIKEFTVCNRSEPSERRIRLGVEMLLDRVCVGGGWNCGNSVVYEAPLLPHVEATAIALLALQGEKQTPAIRTSVAWLKQRSNAIKTVESLAWSVLSLFVYQEPVDHLKTQLAALIEDGREVRDNATLATALLALKCGEMIHPFMVLR